MKVYQIEKLQKFAIFAVIALHPVSVLGQSDQTSNFTDATICKTIRHQVLAINRDISPFDRPKLFKVTDLAWPTWTAIAPSTHLPEIVKTVMWQYARENRPDMPLSEYYSYAGTPIQQKQELQFLKDLYENYIKDGQLEMQYSELLFVKEPFPGEKKVKGVLLRFRVNPSEAELQKIVTRKDRHYPIDYSWEYVIENVSGSNVVYNTPITLGAMRVGGELAEVGDTLKLFDTSPGAQTVFDIYIESDERARDQYHVLDVYPVCNN